MDNERKRTRMHHPWDEVSLPGAGGGAAEPTILEVLNRTNTDDEEKSNQTSEQSEDIQDTQHNKTSSSELKHQEDNASEEARIQKEKSSRSNITNNTECIKSSELKGGISQAPVGGEGEKILDIESHLIETLENNSGVDIKELQPAKYELTQGSSKIETETSPRTLIEVKPASPKHSKPVRTVIHQPPLHQVVDRNCKSGETQETIPPLAASLLEKTTSNEKTEEPLVEVEDNTLSHQVDEKLSEVTSLLKANDSGKTVEQIPTDLTTATASNQIIVDVNGLPLSKTHLEAEERKLFIDSLPQISAETDSNKLSAEVKKEYYQSLRKYLVESTLDKPPVPLQTYRWEDLKRARERGGYPWTHLYKRPLGPDEQPEIVLLLRKSQELHFVTESPRSLKKVRIDDQVSVKETERYIQELSDHEEDNPTTEEDDSRSTHSESISCVSDSVLTVASVGRKASRLKKIRGILKRRDRGRTHDDAVSLPDTLVASEKRTIQTSKGNGIEPKAQYCHPIMKKLRNMADRQKKRMNIKKISLKKDEKITLDEETKILKLKTSPKAERGEIPHFIEKQDSDDVLEIVELDESPSRKRKDDGKDESLDEDHSEVTKSTSINNNILVPDEIIQIPAKLVSESTDGDIQCPKSEAPKKVARLRREHVYEDIENAEMPGDGGEFVGEQINEILDLASVEALKQSLTKQDNSILKQLESTNKEIPLDRMGSSEEEQISVSHQLAPLSSIDSASSDEDRGRFLLSPVSEESDVASVDGVLSDKEHAKVIQIVEDSEKTIDLKPSLKKEPSPAPSDKKVTFSHVEDEAEPHREDIALPDELSAGAASNRWRNMSDHEYEPIGEPPHEEASAAAKKESSPALPKPEISAAMEIEDVEQHDRDERMAMPPDGMNEAEELQKDLEERYLSSAATTPNTESRTDYEVHISQVDSSALEELPLSPENRKKSFIASAQDRTRKMQAGLKTQAGKIKTKFRSPKKVPSGSPKAKDRKRFKAPEFSKLKIPEIRRPVLPKLKSPDMSKLKDFKRPEFTKFSKPDMSKFKLPDKFSSLKLTRSKSFKESDATTEENMSGVTADSGVEKPTITVERPQKKKFEFNFSTYPRAFRKKIKPTEPHPILSTGTGTAEEDPSLITSTETQQSLNSSSSPQGDRGPGPVRSRWADKFSDVSYNDSEGSRYRQYGSEQESFDRESSMERRMKDDLDEAAIAESDLGILNSVVEDKQFAEFDEENRAIHEISKIRAGEFKRRPMVHQDSDLVSEESKDVVGWTEKEVQKNKMLRKAELEAEAGYQNYPSEEGLTTGSINTNQETLSTASSGGGKNTVMEEIDDDEFFLRKRGISEDDIELRQYISTAIREGFDVPVNALKMVGQSEPIEYEGYDVPPPKPRRLNQYKSYVPELDASQEFDDNRHDYKNDNISPSQTGSEYFKSPPSRPLRKGRSRSKYSIDSQDFPSSEHHQYFDDDEDYLRPRPPDRMHRDSSKEENVLQDFDLSEKENFSHNTDHNIHPPLVPRRRKKFNRNSMEKDDSFINGFDGRSVSNSFLQSPEDVIVYRTEHKYQIPLATPENYTDGASQNSRKSRSLSRFGGAADEDDRTSRGAESLSMDAMIRSDFEQNQNVQGKFIIDMMENDGYAIVRKDPLPKPTPPARRKKFSRSPGERFATMPHTHKYSMLGEEVSKLPVIGRPMPPRRKSALSLDNTQNMEEYHGYAEPEEPEEPELEDRPESPRNLQSGEIINKMKYRPLPPPPRPPREKRRRSESRERQDDGEDFDDRDGGGERVEMTSAAGSYDHNEDYEFEVEVSTQTDPLPDDFVCEEFEITDDMKVIEPRCAKTIEDVLTEEQEARQEAEDEQLVRGLLRFRDANQRSFSEKSRASSQADRSKSHSRPQTPSAIVIERRVSTPVPNFVSETMLEASLTVHPIDDLDLDEEAIRRVDRHYGESMSKSDAGSQYQEEEQRLTDDQSHVPSSVDLEEAIEILKLQQESAIEEEVRKQMRQEYENELKQEQRQDYEYSDNEQLHLHEDDDDDNNEAESLMQREQSLTDRQNREDESIERPLPPPRRRSTTANEFTETAALLPAEANASLATATTVEQSLPNRLAVTDLEVERLRVHALQAGQIMVSQLNSAQINADELGCKSANLVVKNIEFPEGFIEEIIERVRNTERTQLHAVETQTSLQASLGEGIEQLSSEQLDRTTSVRETVAEVPPTRPPPPEKQAMFPSEYMDSVPPASFFQLRNPNDESTSINKQQHLQALPRGVSPADYLQSIAPLSFHNLRNPSDEPNYEPTSPVVHRRRRHHRRRSSSSEEEHRRRRSRSAAPTEPQSIAQAGRQFISACSISLVNIINQLTNSLRPATTGEDGAKQQPAIQTRYVSILVALFILITFGMLLFLLSGKNVHHHHWDYFNPPGNSGGTL